MPTAQSIRSASLVQTRPSTVPLGGPRAKREVSRPGGPVLVDAEDAAETSTKMAPGPADMRATSALLNARPRRDHQDMEARAEKSMWWVIGGGVCSVAGFMLL